MKFKHIPLYKIRIEENIRSDPDDEIGELMESIERHDVIQPILVVPRGDKFELVSGHRRFAAMKARNEPTIPAYIREDLSESDIPLVKLTENIHRKQMSPRELVRLFDQMRAVEPGLSQAKLAQRIGKSPAWVHFKYVADREIEKLIDSGVDGEVAESLTENDLLKLHRVKDPKEKAALAKKSVKQKVKISEAESYTVSRRRTFQFRVVARRKVEVLCGSDAALGKLLDYLGAEETS